MYGMVDVYSHSPFRQHKTKDKSEIDNMTLNMVRSAAIFSPSIQLYSPTAQVVKNQQ